MNAKQAVQSGRAAFGESAQAGTQRFITAGRWREAVEKSTQIEAGAAADYGEVSAGLNAGQDLPGEFGVPTCGQFAINIRNVYKMMRDAAPLRCRELGGPDIQSAIDLNRVAVEDFSLERFAKHQGELAFARAGGAEHRDQRPQRKIRVSRHGNV